MSPCLFHPLLCIPVCFFLQTPDLTPFACRNVKSLVSPLSALFFSPRRSNQGKRKAGTIRSGSPEVALPSQIDTARRVLASPVHGSARAALPRSTTRRLPSQKTYIHTYFTGCSRVPLTPLFLRRRRPLFSVFRLSLSRAKLR